MITTTTCPKCNTIITLDMVHVHCNQCGREVGPGEYIVAPRGRHVGRPICVNCIEQQMGLNLLGEAAKPNGAATRPLGQLGPTPGADERFVGKLGPSEVK